MKKSFGEKLKNLFYLEYILHHLNYFYNFSILIYVINIFHLIQPKEKKAKHLFDKVNIEKNHLLKQ